MISLIIYLGSFYIAIGTIFLFVPLIYLELGRPKDLIKAFLNLLIGFILIIKNNTVDESIFLIFLLFTVLIFLYIVELFSYRWNQLTENEKIKIITVVEFKKNILKFLEAIALALSNFPNFSSFLKIDFKKQNSNKKKWVRNDSIDV